MTPSLRRVLVLCVTAALVVAVASGCRLSGRNRLGTVVITTSMQQLSARNAFQPDHSDVVDFHVYGLGSAGDVVDLPVTGTPGQIVVPDLVPGWWRFDVDGVNVNGAPILSGSADVYVAQASTTPVQIVLAPIEGTGTLVVRFTWPTDALPDPDVSALLAHYVAGDDVFGPDEVLGPFIPSEAGGVATRRYEATHDAGYYRLTAEFTNNGYPVGEPYVHAVRILDGLQTMVTIDLETGSVDIEIILDPQNPLVVTLAIVGDVPVSVGESITVNSSVTGGVGPFTYRWYLNGALLPDEDESSIVIGALLAPRRYRLSLIASNGTVLGSDWVAFDVVP